MNTPTSGDEYVAETVLRLNNLGLHSASELVESQAATIATLQRESVDMRLRYAGCVGLLAECCVYVPEDERESIERACLDWAAGTKWGVRRILNRIDLTPPRADEEPKA